MATTAFLLVAAVAMLISPAVSQNCASHKFTQNVQFSNCTDLPTLRAYLHWTYDATAPRPTLSIAFTAPPPDPDGWVSWALNPTAPSMAGAQAFIAFEDTNGSVVARTYNIETKGPVSESRISYEVLSKSAVSSNGLTTIFAVIVWPQNSGTVYQVWQVGSSVENGVPQVHGFARENLDSTGELRLGSTASVPIPVPAPRPAPGPGANTSPPPNRAVPLGPRPAPGPGANMPPPPNRAAPSGPRAAPGPGSNTPPPPSPSAGHSVAKLGIQAIYAGLVALGILTLLSS